MRYGGDARTDKAVRDIERQDKETVLDQENDTTGQRLGRVRLKDRNRGNTGRRNTKFGQLHELVNQQNRYRSECSSIFLTKHQQLSQRVINTVFGRPNSITLSRATWIRVRQFNRHVIVRPLALHHQRATHHNQQKLAA